MKRRPGRRLSVGSIVLQVQGQEKKPERGFELTGRGGKRHSVCRRRLNGAAAAFSRCLPAATPERRDGEGREEANQISSIKWIQRFKNSIPSLPAAATASSAASVRVRRRLCGRRLTQTQPPPPPPPSLPSMLPSGRLFKIQFPLSLSASARLNCQQGSACQPGSRPPGCSKCSSVRPPARPSAKKDERSLSSEREARGLDDVI